MLRDEGIRAIITRSTHAALSAVNPFYNLVTSGLPRRVATMQILLGNGDV